MNPPAKLFIMVARFIIKFLLFSSPACRLDGMFCLSKKDGACFITDYREEWGCFITGLQLDTYCFVDGWVVVVVLCVGSFSVPVLILGILIRSRGMGLFYYRFYSLTLIVLLIVGWSWS